MISTKNKIIQLAKLVDLLRDKTKQCNESTLAKSLKIEPRTVYRYLNFLGELGYKIEFNQDKKSYQISGERQLIEDQIRRNGKGKTNQKPRPRKRRTTAKRYSNKSKNQVTQFMTLPERRRSTEERYKTFCTRRNYRSNKRSCKNCSTATTCGW